MRFSPEESPAFRRGEDVTTTGSVMTDHGFGAVARGEFDRIPAAMLKALIDAAVENERARIAATEVGFETNLGRA